MTITLSQEKKIMENSDNEQLALEMQEEGQKENEKERDIPIDELITPEVLEKLRTMDDESWDFLYLPIKCMLEKFISKSTFSDIKSDIETINSIISQTIIAFQIQLKRNKNLKFDGKKSKASSYIGTVLQRKLIDNYKKSTKRFPNINDLTATKDNESGTIDPIEGAHKLKFYQNLSTKVVDFR